jgi:hypothetical protein
MKNRFHTDFLCPQSSFLVGMGSVLNLSGGYYRYNTSENPDELAVAVDWFMTGQDIAGAFQETLGDSPVSASRDASANERSS